MRIFLTGGSGLLGGYVAERARAEGAEVVALVRPSSAAGRLLACGAALAPGDLLDPDSLAAGLRGCDAVLHLASPKGGWRRPEVYREATVRGTLNLLAAMRAAGVRRLIHCSTVSVHGLDPLACPPVDERSGFGRCFLPYDFYGRAKAAAEQLVRQAHDAGTVQATVLRPGWVYGPGDARSYARLAGRLRRGALLRIGDGHNRLPLVYAGNVAGALWHALASPARACRVYLYAYDGVATQNSYIASLLRATGVARPVPAIPRGLALALAAAQEHAAALSGYRIPALITRYFVHLFASPWHFDQRRLQEELGFTPPVGYERGFALTEAWYRSEAGRPGQPR